MADESTQQERFLQALEFIAFETLSVSSACEKVGLPRRVFWHLVSSDDKNGELYMRARSIRASQRVEEINKLEQEMSEVARKCDPRRANALIQAYKMRIDNVKWLASKENSRHYGDKVEVNANVTTTRTVRLPPKSPEGADVT